MAIAYGDEEGVREISLTFDDGPNPRTTSQVLDILKDHEIKATFFVLGERLESEQGQDILARAHAEGHLIGNHTYSHPNLRKLAPSQIRDQLTRTEELIEDYLSSPKLFRPPYGASDAEVREVVQDKGYHSVMWNVDTLDWKKKDGSWVEHGFEQIEAREDSLVLMHDIHDSTAANLNRLLSKIDQLQNARYIRYV